jgi:hypothetical protein
VPASRTEDPKRAAGRLRRPALDLGHLPAIALCAALGLLLCSLDNGLGRAALQPTTLTYWAGLLLIALPIFYRLGSKEPSPGERLLLVVLLGLALYGVKVVRDSLLFNFPDELVHAFNAQQIVEHHHLYRFNPALPVTPHYPGLGSATSALMTLTGMSSFGAGTLVIAAGRLTFVTALFLLFNRIGGSARAAGLGVAIYTGSSNFLFWGAQFSYESLALPLLVVVLMCFVEREAAAPSWRAAWLVPIVLGILAIAVTHHITSYAAAAILIALAILYRVFELRAPNPWPLALFATVVAAGWLLIAARQTVGYLSPVLGDAIRAIFKTASGETAPRTLFHASANTVGVTPFPARAVALLAIALLGIGFVFGIRVVWRRFRREPLVLLFCLASLGFFAALVLRFAPAAWETGNRAGEFLFLGLAFVVTYGAAELLRAGPNLRRRRLLLVAGLGIVLVGGAISGWPWDVQLARPLKVTAEERRIVSEPLALAEWAKRRFSGHRFAAPEADARMLMAPGGQIAFGGQGPDVEDIVSTPQLAPWQLPVLRRHHLPYVVADRRQISSDTLRGYYFEIPGQEGEELYPPDVVHKFSKIPAGRLWDSGRIVLYDLESRP